MTSHEHVKIIEGLHCVAMDMCLQAIHDCVRLADQNSALQTRTADLERAIAVFADQRNWVLATWRDDHTPQWVGVDDEQPWTQAQKALNLKTEP